MDTHRILPHLNRVYSGALPEELYLVTGQWNAFVDTFAELGYNVEPVVDTTLIR